MEVPMRNPFCISNHPAADQIKFYQRVFLTTSIFLFFVALATLLWAWIWMSMSKDTPPIMPCRGNGNTFGVLRMCNESVPDGGNALGSDDGCDESSALSVCAEDSCVTDPFDENQVKSCWYLAAFVMTINASYMLLLFRRDAAGKGLLSCACFIEGMLGGAGTLHYDSSVFVEAFTYMTCTCVLTTIAITVRSKKVLPDWESLPSQVGSSKGTVPEVEEKIIAFLKQNVFASAGLVAFIAFVWHFGISARLTGGSNLAFFLALIVLAISTVWMFREISWTQHKFDPDQHINMCISFHVDLYCIFILFCIFVFFSTSAACSQGGPVMCFPMFCSMMAQQCERACRFGCGCAKPASMSEEGAVAAGAVAAAGAAGVAEGGKPKQSIHAQKEVETEEQWKKRKMINAGCAFGLLALGGMAFVAPALSFLAASAVCIGLPMYRAAQNKTEEQTNV
jgi:hypothetical protein